MIPDMKGKVAMIPGLGKPRAAELAADLPPPAAEKLRRLGDVRVEKFNASRLLGERIDEQLSRKHAAEARLRHLVSAETGITIKRDHPSAQEQQRIIDAATAEIARLEVLRRQRSDEAQAAGRALANCEAWLHEALLGGNAFEPVEVDADLKKAETLAAAVERIQRRGRELQADLNRVQAAPRPSAWAKAKLREQIDAMAERGRPYVGGLIEHGEPVRFSDVSRSAMARGGDVPTLAQWEEPDVLALAVWLHRDALIAALDREIDAEADDAAALADGERRRREEQLVADILHAERIEAALAWRLADEGQPIAFRDGISAEAVLGLRAVPRPAPTPTPERQHPLVSLWPFGSSPAE